MSSFYDLATARHYPDIVARILQGDLVLYPTDTLRGIGAIVTQISVDRIKKLKSRPGDKLFMSIIAPGWDWIKQYGDHVDCDLLRQQWTQYQGTTFIIPLQEPLASYYQSIGMTANHTIGARICDHPIQDIVNRLGQPLISTSANRSGESNPLTYDAINPLIIQGVDIHLIGDLLYGKPSTLINTITGEVITRS